MVRFPMARSVSHAGAPSARLLVAGCLMLGCLGMGCGRTDSAPPVSEHEMEELDLDFDLGFEAPSESPKDVDDGSSETP